jgi:hypothetical protein
VVHQLRDLGHDYLAAVVNHLPDENSRNQVAA